jgi:hypothetical protein
MDSKKRQPGQSSREHGEYGTDASTEHPNAAPFTINPVENNLTLNPGETHTETIIVTVPATPGKEGYRNVKLVAAGGTAVFVVSITPAAGYGPLPPTTQQLKFEVTFRGVVPCKESEQVLTGTLDVVADGKAVAQKRVRIAVPACPRETFIYSYSVKFLCGEQPVCPCECTSVRPGIYATEINIHNYHEKDVKVAKRVTPVVLSGVPMGREPKFAGPKAADRINLPPHTATMDDCCRLAELLFGGKPSSPMPLTIGFLEITSPQELVVTAVYTVSDLTSGSVSIDVEQISGAKVKIEPPKPEPVPTPPPHQPHNH